MWVDPYTYPRRFRSCMNCIHYLQPLEKFSGVWTGGCKEKFERAGYTKNMLQKTYCGQWFLQQLTEEY